MSDEEKIQTAALGILGLLGLDQLRKNRRRKRDSEGNDDNDDDRGEGKKTDPDKPMDQQIAEAISRSEKGLGDAAAILQDVLNLDVPKDRSAELTRLNDTVGERFDNLRTTTNRLAEKRDLSNTQVRENVFSKSTVVELNSLASQVEVDIEMLQRSYNELKAAVDRYNIRMQEAAFSREKRLLLARVESTLQSFSQNPLRYEENFDSIVNENASLREIREGIQPQIDTILEEKKKLEDISPKDASDVTTQELRYELNYFDNLIKDFFVKYEEARGGTVFVTSLQRKMMNVEKTMEATLKLFWFLFDEVDTNRNGTVSKTELQQYLKSEAPLKNLVGADVRKEDGGGWQVLYTAMDADQNGSFSRMEFGVFCAHKLIGTKPIDDEVAIRQFHYEKDGSGGWDDISADMIQEYKNAPVEIPDVKPAVTNDGDDGDDGDNLANIGDFGAKGEGTAKKPNGPRWDTAEAQEQMITRGLRIRKDGKFILTTGNIGTWTKYIADAKIYGNWLPGSKLGPHVLQSVAKAMLGLPFGAENLKMKELEEMFIDAGVRDEVLKIKTNKEGKKRISGTVDDLFSMARALLNRHDAEHPIVDVTRLEKRNKKLRRLGAKSPAKKTRGAKPKAKTQAKPKAEAKTRSAKPKAKTQELGDIFTNILKRRGENIIEDDEKVIATAQADKGSNAADGEDSDDSSGTDGGWSASEDEAPEAPLADPWAGISNSAKRRILDRDPAYESLEDFLNKVKTVKQFDEKIKRGDVKKVAGFLSKLKGKEITNKPGIIAELRLKTAADELKEEELKQDLTKAFVRRKWEALQKRKGDIAINQAVVGNYSNKAALYAAEHKKDNITAKMSRTTQKKMAILYDDEFGNTIPKTAGLSMLLRPSTGPKLRF